MTEPSLQEWIGRTDSVADHISRRQAEALAATFDRSVIDFADGAALPPLWHWMHFLEKPRSASLAADGHPHRGGVLPPVDLPRRMWAGSRLRFHQPLRIGEAARRDSRITNVVEKQGRSGALVIVTVTHSFEGGNGLALTEEQDIVYREPPQAGAMAPGGGGPEPAFAPEWSRAMTADPVLLFRYSALTFNSHRIHYDQPYATEAEGYPGLVVHGPLVATLLLEEMSRTHPDRTLSALTIRALRPLFHGTEFRLQGGLAAANDRAELWCLNAAGDMTLQASAELAP